MNRPLSLKSRPTGSYLYLKLIINHPSSLGYDEKWHILTYSLIKPKNSTLSGPYPLTEKASRNLYSHFKWSCWHIPLLQWTNLDSNRENSSKYEKWCLKTIDNVSPKPMFLVLST